MDESPAEIGLDVDGSRPSVAWVTSLPSHWLSAGERLVLLVLACDAFDDVSAPGGDNLTRWSGLLRSTVYDIIGRLSQPAGERPALIERQGSDGRPLAGKQYGRERTRYRLRVETTQQSGLTGQLNSPGSPDGYALQQSGRTGQLPPPNSPAEPDSWTAQQSGQQSGNSPAKPDTPFPYPGLSNSSPHVTTGQQRSASNGWDWSKHTCQICNRPHAACRRAAANTGDDHAFTPSSAIGA